MGLGGGSGGEGRCEPRKGERAAIWGVI